jgi:hypothetical protein
VLNFYYAFREFKFYRFTQVSSISLKTMPKSFDLTCKKGHYPHYSNKAMHLDYMCPYPEPKYYGFGFMSGNERVQLLELYEGQKAKIVRNKEELLVY